MSWYETKHWVYESYSQFDIAFHLRGNESVKLICPTQWGIINSEPQRFAIYENNIFLKESNYHKLVNDDMNELVNTISFIILKNQYK